MRKSFLLGFVLMMVFCFLKADIALSEEKNYKLGGDVRLREEYMDNILDYNSNTDDMANYLRLRLRVFGEYLPTPSFRLYTRITGEPRYYFDPNQVHDIMRDEFVFDNLFAEFKGGQDVKYKTTIGRQDLMLGSGWLMTDGTPIDGSRTIYTDAVRENVAFDKYTLDIFLSQVKKSDPLPIINDQDLTLQEEDQVVHGVYLSDKLNDTYTIDGYYFYHKTDTDVSDMSSNTVGTRIQAKASEEVNLSGDLAYQTAEFRSDENNPGFGGELSLSYKPKNMDNKPELKLSMAYLPGDDSSSGTYEGWDPVNGRYPRYSELYVYSLAREKAVAYWTNMQVYTAQVSLVPVEDLSCTASINYFKANDNPKANTSIFGDGKERGWLYFAKASYNFNKTLSGHLWVEYFVPGDYYASANQDDGYFLRWELMEKF
jgi:hypothetical protein